MVQGTILAVASIISRMIGLVYRIPLRSILGDIGMSYYSCAFEIYNMLLFNIILQSPDRGFQTGFRTGGEGEKEECLPCFKGHSFFAVVSGSVAAVIIYLARLISLGHC